MDDLTRFLRAASQRPFSWGGHRGGADCLTWLGEWVGVRHGVDPSLRLRPLYRDRASAYRLILKHGTRAALIDACVAPFGIQRTDDPRRGDIALVAAPDGPEGRSIETGAIVLGRMVASIGDREVRSRHLPILTAWRV